jgi:hypothetical protein
MKRKHFVKVVEEALDSLPQNFAYEERCDSRREEMASSETIRKLELQNRNLGIFVLLGSFSRTGRCPQTSLLEM